MKKEKILIRILLLTSILCFGQNNNLEDWTINEKAQYLKLTELAQYVSGKQKAEISKDTLFDKFVYFDYVINDTDIERRERRFAAFDTLFYRFRKMVDSVGIENLDAKPIRFYKNTEIYESFDDELTEFAPYVLAYYKKEDAENPLGTLLFEPKTNKLLAWIMIDQGGYKYFLIFNLF